MRTALVVSSRSYNSQGADVVCACITKNLQRPPEAEDIPVLADGPEFAASGLKFPSMVRCGKLFTFDCTEQHAKLKRFSDQFMTEVSRRILAVFGGVPATGSSTGA